MVMSNQLSAGMTIILDQKLFRVESCTKVTVPKGNPFMKAKLRNLKTDRCADKNFQLSQELNEVSLEERMVEFLYEEGKDFLFLDVENLVQVLASKDVVGNWKNFLKEGVSVKAAFYGDIIFSLEVPQFLELMVTHTESVDDSLPVSNATKQAVLETGASIEVPPFIEVGDVIKVDTSKNEFIQRV